MKKLNLFYYLFLIFTVISLINLNLNKVLGVSLIKLQKSESNFTELVKCPVGQIFSNKAKKCMPYTKIETKLDCNSLIYQNIFNSEDTFYCFDIKSNKLNIEAHRLLGDKFQKYNTSLSLTSQSDISKSDNLSNSVFEPFKNSKYFYGLITFGMGNTNLYLYKFGRDLNKVKISNQFTINHQSGSIFFKDVYDLRDNRNFKLIIGYRNSIESFSVYILNGSYDSNNINLNLANKIDFSGEGSSFKLFKDLQGNVYFLYSDKQTEDLKKLIKVFKFNPDKNNIDLWKEFGVEEYKIYSTPVSIQDSFAFTTITPISNTNQFIHNTYVVNYNTKNLEHKYKHVLDNINNSNYQSDEYGVYSGHTIAAAIDRSGNLSFEEYYYNNTFNLPSFICSSGNPGELKEFAKVYDTNSAKFVVLSLGGNSLIFGNNPYTQRLIYNNLNSDHFRTVIKEDRSCEITLSNTDNLKIGESIKVKERIIQVIYDTETTGRYSIIDEIEKKLTKLGGNKYSNYAIWTGYGFSLSSNSFSFLTDEVVSDFDSNSSERNTVLHTYLIKENNNSYAVQEEKQDDDSFFLFKIFRSIVDIFTRIFS